MGLVLCGSRAEGVGWETATDGGQTLTGGWETATGGCGACSGCSCTVKGSGDSTNDMLRRAASLSCCDLVTSGSN